MPRKGGEADKLGNHYEEIWTVESLLDVFEGVAVAITIEPLGEESLGIEFIKETNDGMNEYHSVKSQTTSNTWSLSELTATSKAGRSILKDLLDKVSKPPINSANFISSTTANDLNELCRIADRSENGEDFRKRLEEQQPLKKKTEKHISTILGGNIECYWSLLKRLTVVGITKTQLIKNVEKRISYLIYKPGGEKFDALEVRLLLGNAINNWLGTRVTQDTVSNYLKINSFLIKEWNKEETLLELIKRRNFAFSKSIESELINGEEILRNEATLSLQALDNASIKNVVLVGAAGLGKSCTLTQVVKELVRNQIPVLTLRLDLQTNIQTTEALGREIGLPTSPVLTLAGISEGSRAVLVVDQLDALSYASGRNQHLWPVLEELLEEGKSFPSLKVILACRAFDAQHDHRLRRLLSESDRTKRVDLDFLSLENVKGSLEKSGVSPENLSEKDLQLLRTPQNLSLFLQSDPRSHNKVVSVQNLMDRYWDHKRRVIEQRLGRPSKWPEIIQNLTSWLSDRQTLSAPKDILDKFGRDVDVLASEHVLIIEDKLVKFFHESVFDYAFSRTHVSKGRNAISLLLDSGTEQHLFRRAQVRQILSYERDRSFTEYLNDLKQVLTNSKVRIHIKKLVLDWLRELPDPKPKEWKLLQSLSSRNFISLWWKNTPHGSVAWFDLLLSLGTWETWLASEDDDLINHAIWLLGQKKIMITRSDQVADLINPFLDGSVKWRKRFSELIFFGELHHGRKLFDIVLWGLREGWFEESSEHLWHNLDELPHHEPDFSIDALEVILERIFKEKPEGDPFIDSNSKYELTNNFFRLLTEKESFKFTKRIFPIIAEEIDQRRHTESSLDFRDCIWTTLSFGGYDYNFKAAFLHGLKSAMKLFASSKPQEFRDLTKPYLQKQSHTLGYLLLESWLSNGEEFANEIAQYLCENPHRLDIGYSSWGGGGDGTAAISRQAIALSSKYCLKEWFIELEKCIINFRDPLEQQTPKYNGWTQLLLLKSLDQKRMTSRSLSKQAELERKFPNQSDELPELRNSKASFMGSPITKNAITKMKDSHWISAMSRYSSDKLRTPGKGGKHELCSSLELAAQTDKERFAVLAQSMPEAINKSYFDAILRGIVKTETDPDKDLSNNPGLLQLLDLVTLENTFRRVHMLPLNPCGRSLCSAIEMCKSRKLSDDTYDILSYYAINDPNPDKESWKPEANNGKPYYGGNPLSAGINSVRGRATWAIGSLLFERQEIWPRLRDTVISLTQDPSIAVRACVVRILIALLNIDRDEAVQLFIKLTQNAPEVLSTAEVDSFLHYALFTHYEQLSSTLRDMLNQPHDKTRSAAARQITVVALSESIAKNDMELVLDGDEVSRTAAAGVFAHNLSNPTTRDICRMHLQKLFTDKDENVRDTATRCFQNLTESQMVEEKNLINAFIQSPAFENNADYFIHNLKESNFLIPDIIIALPERVIQLCKNSKKNETSRPRRRPYYISEILIRLYRQTSDDFIKKRCLDMIDQLIELGFNEITADLQEIER